jgi:hypothetical protein
MTSHTNVQCIPTSSQWVEESPEQIIEVLGGEGGDVVGGEGGDLVTGEGSTN